MKIKNILHNFFRHLYFNENKGVLADTFRILLQFLVPIYSFLRYCDYWLKSARRRRLSTPVVSVGNLSVGGTAKTAFVLWLVGELKQSGYNCAVLKRGQGEKNGILRGEGDQPARYGDEAALVNKHFPEVPVGVGSRRWQWGKKIEEKFPEVDIFILDDGFQHYQLERNLDLVLIGSLGELEASRLPAGPLREGVSALQRSDFLSLQTEGAKLPEVWEKICARYVQSSPMGHFYRFQGIWRDREEVTESFRGEQIILLSTLARPEKLARFVENEGFEVQETITLPDHARIDQSVLSGVDLQRVVVTEKELVKLPESLRREVGCLRSELVVQSAGEFLAAVQKLVEVN